MSTSERPEVGLREAWAHVVRDHDHPPDKDSHGYDYRMGWWDAILYANRILTRGLRSCDDCPGPLTEHPAAEADPTAGEGLCGPCRRGQTQVCDGNKYLHCDNAATPDASGGLSEALTAWFAENLTHERFRDWSDEKFAEALSQYLTAHPAVADAKARARREHGEKIAQAIEVLPGPNLAGIARWRSTDSREGYLLAIEEATRVARSLSSDAAEGEGREEG